MIISRSKHIGSTQNIQGATKSVRHIKLEKINEAGHKETNAYLMWQSTEEPYNYELEQMQFLHEVKLKDKHTKFEEIRPAKISAQIIQG